jgi:hypothetical protein
MKYTVTVSFAGKTYKAKVDAESGKEAIAKVKSRLKILKVERDAPEIPNDDYISDLLGIFGIKK